MVNKKITESRKEEIISACLSLYKKFNFKDITLKEISEYTSFSRPSIYNYFETKEEIFLAIIQKEYELWKNDLDKIAIKKNKMTAALFAKELSKTLENRALLLKLLSMNLFDIEEHSRLEKLIEFKEAYGATIKSLSEALKRSFPKYTKLQCEKFIYTFLPFMIGIYPSVYSSKKQSKAMDKAGIKLKKQSIGNLANEIITKLL